jgi:hypothetical protein
LPYSLLLVALLFIEIWRERERERDRVISILEECRDRWSHVVGRGTWRKKEREREADRPPQLYSSLPLTLLVLV